MAALEDFQAFDVANGALNLWTFKKSQQAGAAAPTFTGHWVGITGALEAALKNAIIEARAQISEVLEYDLLAQNNEASALTIGTLETHAGLIVDAAADELPGRKATILKHLRNAAFYSVKVVSNGATLHAVARTNDTWRTKKAGGILPVVFSDEELELEDSPAFSLSKYFDFFIIENYVLISNKSVFESILSYKEAHANEFADLQAEPEFIAIFDNMAEISAYVGTNKMHLRRAHAIRQKGHYKDANFMTALRAEHVQAGLTINFDAAGRIVPSSATCPHIFQALLDHRLMSRFSKKNYDVPSTSDA